MREENRLLNEAVVAENNKTMNEAFRLVENYRNYPHSRSIREKAVLKALFDQHVKAKRHPKDVLKAIQDKMNSFTGADSTRPSFS